MSNTIFVRTSKFKTYEATIVGKSLDEYDEANVCQSYFEIRCHGKLLDGDSRLCLSSNKDVNDLIMLSTRMIGGSSKHIKSSNGNCSIDRDDNKITLTFSETCLIIQDKPTANNNYSGAIEGDTDQILNALSNLASAKDFELINTETKWLIPDSIDGSVDSHVKDLKTSLIANTKLRPVILNSIVAFSFKFFSNNPDYATSTEAPKVKSKHKHVEVKYGNYDHKLVVNKDTPDSRDDMLFFDGGADIDLGVDDDDDDFGMPIPELVKSVDHIDEMPDDSSDFQFEPEYKAPIEVELEIEIKEVITSKESDDFEFTLEVDPVEEKIEVEEEVNTEAYWNEPEDDDELVEEDVVSTVESDFSIGLIDDITEETFTAPLETDKPEKQELKVHHVNVTDFTPVQTKIDLKIKYIISAMNSINSLIDEDTDTAYLITVLNKFNEISGLLSSDPKDGDLAFTMMALKNAQLEKKIKRLTQ